MLLDDLIDRWFEEYANKQLKAKTLYDYRRMRGRISAGLGHLKVSKIKPAHVMAFYNNLEEKGCSPGQHLHCHESPSEAAPTWNPG